MSRVSEKEEKLRTSLKQFPSHFQLENDPEYKKCLTRANMHLMIDRMKDDEQLYSSQNRPWYEHELCRDKNLTNFLNYKLSRPEFPVPKARGVVVNAKKMCVRYPKNMVALSNLAHIYLILHNSGEAEKCLERLNKHGAWERLLAEAEMAYAYRRIGPQCHLKCLELFEKVIGPLCIEYQEDQEPNLVQSLEVIWSYEAAQAIERILNPSVIGNLKSGNYYKYPEELMTKSCILLERVISSELGIYRYVARPWLTLVNTYREYLTVIPRKKRKIRLETLSWPGFSVEKCFEKAEEAFKTFSKKDYLALMMLGQAYRRKANDIIKGRVVHDEPNKAAGEYLEQARLYLQRAEELSTKPAIYHHLSLVYRDEWLMEKNAVGLPHYDNIRDPGNPKLQQVIDYLKKAIDYSHGTCVVFKIELARAKFSFFRQPITNDQKKEIINILLTCVEYTKVRDLTTDSIQSYLLHQLALMYEELNGDLKQCRDLLELSAQKATSGANFPKDFKKLYDMIEEEMREAPQSERCIALGDLNTLVCRRRDASRQYGQALEEISLTQPDAEKLNKLKDLTKRFIQIKSFLEARRCLKRILGIDSQYLQNLKNRETFIDVCLQVVRQFEPIPIIAAYSYQDLLDDLKPINKVNKDAKTVLILSTGDSTENENSKRIVDMIRKDLGVGEENCVWWSEGFHGNLNDPETDVDEVRDVNDGDHNGIDEDLAQSITKEDLEWLANELQDAKVVEPGEDKCSGREGEDDDDQESEENCRWLMEEYRLENIDPVTDTDRQCFEEHNRKCTIMLQGQQLRN